MIEVIQAPEQEVCSTGCETIKLTYQLNGEEPETVEIEIDTEGEYRIEDFLYGTDLIISFIDDTTWVVLYSFQIQASLTQIYCPFGTFTIPEESMFESFIIENVCFTSKWQAVHHPIKWQLQRKDALVISTSSALIVSLKFKLELSTTPPLGVVAGINIDFYDTLGVKRSGVILVISGNFLIVSNNYVLGVVVKYVIFPQLYKNYFIETSVLENGTTEIGTLRTIPNSVGLAFVDVHRVLKTKALYENTYNYTSPSAIDVGLSGKYKLKFRENYNFTQQSYGDLTDFRYWSNSAKQIRDLYGSNMAEYVGNLEIPCKFLSVFERPTNFIGYPFSLSYITSGDWTRELRRLENGSTRTAIALPSGYLNRLLVSDTATSVLIEYGFTEIPSLDWITEGNLTETKEIKINNECLLNAVALSWLNTLGGREHWVFRYNQIHSIDTSTGATFEPYINDLQNSRSNIFDLERFEQQKITLGASVDVEDIKGLKTILSSICVEIETAQGWIGVRPETGSFKVYESNGTTSDIEFTIQLPYTNIQSR
jgi:hypothetical protein